MTTVQPRGVGMARTFRWVWGILLLLSLLWICYGLTATGQAVNQVISATPTARPGGGPTADPTMLAAGTAIGASIGGGIGLAFFLCSGLPLAFIFGLLYWRNGVAIRRAREHAELINATVAASKPGGQ